MLEIRRLVVEPDVEEKIWVLHGISRWLLEGVVFDSDSERRWDLDPVHGGRLIVRGFTPEPDPRQLYVVLSPIDDEGTWRCLTAFVPSRTTYGDVADE
jgi:hypothetical protein